jgi:UDP-sugar transporter A1/2/3
VTLALQNALLTIIMHYSRITALPDRAYSAATAVLLNELLKGTFSMYIALRKIDTDMSASSNPAVFSEKNSRIRPSPRSNPLPTLFHPSRLRVLSKSIFSPDCYTLAVPAILYVIQNNLQYVAASNLDVATFQVTYQMKILTTAFFSVFILRKRLSRGKWFALILLAVGVGIVQIQTTSAPAHTPTPSPGVKISHGEHQLRSEIPKAPVLGERTMNPFTGFMAVTAACLTSGLDLWIRNTQLSLFSLVPALVPILVFPTGPAGAGWFERVIGSFSNFNGWAIGTVLTQTFGGLITAVVIRYSDNIM